MSVDDIQQTQHPYLVARARVGATGRLSPSFMRITLVGDDLAGFGNVGATFDQRVKLIFPPGSGVLPHLVDGDDWYQRWLAVPESDRGSMRTYSLRDIRLDDDGATAVDIDFVLHSAPGRTGPASAWAAAAAVGDELMIVGPRRGRFDGGGVEYRPAGAGRVLLAGDETAAPAIARILADAPTALCGVAYIEVPLTGDAPAIDAPDGVAVHWLPRDGAAHGERLQAAVLRCLEEIEPDSATHGGEHHVEDGRDDELVWETPLFSGLGQRLDDGAPAGAGDCYYWIAGESRMVTMLRRRLVKDLGIHRSRVAFMGYWRDGVAMKG